jgi:cation diffusion facilitator family transporter
VHHSYRQRHKWAYRQGWTSILVNLLLFGFKYWAGILSNSLALLADAWHTLSDSLSSIVVLVATRISSKPADKDHPFGHGRAELISAIIIGVLLGMIGIDFLVAGVTKLIDREGVTFGTFAVVVTAASVVVKEALAQFSFWTARKTNNQALRADGWHHRSDAISSAVILAGIVLGKNIWWIDGVLGILVSVLILYAAYEVIKEGANPLMGEKPDEEMVARLMAIAAQSSGRDTHMHHVHLHRYGEHVELTMHIKLPKDIRLDEAHKIANGIEKEIKHELSMTATIHVDPL